MNVDEIRAAIMDVLNSSSKPLTASDIADKITGSGLVIKDHKTHKHVRGQYVASIIRKLITDGLVVHGVPVKVWEGKGFKIVHIYSARNQHEHRQK